MFTDSSAVVLWAIVPPMGFLSFFGIALGKATIIM